MKRIRLSLLILLGLLVTLPQSAETNGLTTGVDVADVFAPSTKCRRQIVPGVSVVSLLLPRGAFECENCCRAAEAAYQDCMRTRSTLCNCLWLARSACINNGCGPCQCCADWETRGQVFSCW